MLACQYVFKPKVKSWSARDRFEEYSVGDYLSNLIKNGQVYREPVLAWIDDALIVTCYIPRPDSLSLKYLSEWGRQSYAELLPQCAIEPHYTIIENRPLPKRYEKWQDAKTLYLFTHTFAHASPVDSGKTGQPVPLYLLPLTASQREGLLFWAAEYKSHDQIWLASGTLEIPAYKQMADPQSELSRTGRDLCRTIETATSLPTYYYLMRYWGRRKGENQRLCPGCGKQWATEFNRKRGRFHQFDFRCDACRLVSHLASTSDSERYAHIGEYRPHKSQ